MKFIGNLLWLVLGGLLMAVVYFLLGILYCITILGIPVGLQAFKMAKLSLWPFGAKVTDNPNPMSFWHLILNILWIVLGGVETAATHAIIGVILCVTIIGIPFGKQHFKLAVLALMPFGKKIV